MIGTPGLVAWVERKRNPGTSLQIGVGCVRLQIKVVTKVVTPATVLSRAERLDIVDWIVERAECWGRGVTV